MPLDKVSGKSLSQQVSPTGISDPAISIPSPAGVSGGNYPKQPTQTTTGNTGDVRGPGSRYDPMKDPQMAFYWNASQEQRSLYDALAQDRAYVGKDGNIHMKPDEGMPWYAKVVAALVTAGAGLEIAGALGAGGAGAGAAAAAPEAAAAAAAPEAAASTIASALPEVAGTLGEVVVPVSGAGAGALGTIGAVAPELGAISMATADLSGATMPTVNAAASSNTMLQRIALNALKKGGINAAVSTVMGGDPIKGFEAGLIGGAIGGGLGAYEASTGALGALGNTGIKAFNAAVAGAGTAAIMGGDPLKSALSGGVGSFVGSELSQLMGTSGSQFDVGQVLGGVAGSMAVNSVMGGGKLTGMGGIAGGIAGNIGGYTSPSVTGAGTQTPFDPFSGTRYGTISDTPITYPTAPYYGLGYRAGGGDVAPSEDEGYFQDQDKLKKLLAALMQQQGEAYG